MDAELFELRSALVAAAGSPVDNSVAAPVGCGGIQIPSISSAFTSTNPVDSDLSNLFAISEQFATLPPVGNGAPDSQLDAVEAEDAEVPKVDTTSRCAAAECLALKRLHLGSARRVVWAVSRRVVGKPRGAARHFRRSDLMSCANMRQRSTNTGNRVDTTVSRTHSF